MTGFLALWIFIVFPFFKFYIQYLLLCSTLGMITLLPDDVYKFLAGARNSAGFERERREPIEAPQVTELHSIEGGQQSENRNSSTDEVSATVQHHQSFNTPVKQQFHQIPVPPHLNTLQHQAQQNPAPVQLHSQCQIASILKKEPIPAPGQLPQTTPEQYQIPLTQQLQAQPIASHQQYQSLHQLPPHSQPHQLPQQHSPVVPVNASPFIHHPEENPYMPRLPQTHQPSFHHLPSMAEPFSHPLPSQQFYSALSSMHEPLPSQCRTGFASRFDQTSGRTSSESYGYSSFPEYRSAAMQSPQIYSSSPSSGSSYPHLPTAQVLPQCVTTERSADGSSSTSETCNQIPVDDVAEKVVTMGFARDQVRAAMKELTDNGLSVDLNTVLDKLMNDGENKLKKGWFRR